MEYIHTRTGSLSSSTRKVGDDSSIELNLEQIAEMSKIVTDGIGSHWLLRGGRQPYMNHLSRRQMATLTTICNTLLQSIDVSSITGDESLQTFFGASSSTNGTPQHVGGQFSGKMNHPKLGLVRLVLWILSTWYGTLVFCGPKSLSSQFPYIQSFTRMPLDKREKVLLSWSLGSFRYHKMLFKCMKFLTLLIYFSLEHRWECPMEDKFGPSAIHGDVHDNNHDYREMGPPIWNAALNENVGEALFSK